MRIHCDTRVFAGFIKNVEVHVEIRQPSAVQETLFDRVLPYASQGFHACVPRAFAAPPFLMVKPLNDDTTTGLLAPVCTAGAAAFAVLTTVAASPAAAPGSTNSLLLNLSVIVSVSLMLAAWRIIGQDDPVRI